MGTERLKISSPEIISSVSMYRLTSLQLELTYQCCCDSVWRPLKGPLEDYPLGVCDYSSVDPEKDYEPSDDVYENHGVDENYLVYRRTGHKWYYLRSQMPTEMLLFRLYDSRIGLRSGMSDLYELVECVINKSHRSSTLRDPKSNSCQGCSP